ncbi:MAG: hypothetical protein WCP22_03330 [Chlamydiota bacterium]
MTGLHDYAYTEPFRYWSFDIRYISDRLVEYIGTNSEIIAARGSRGTLDERLDESLNEDGTLKETAASSLMSQWQVEVAVPAYLNDLEFALTGDVTAVYVEGRRVLMHGGSGYVYATVDSSAYSSPTTTVTVAGGTVPGGIDAVRYGLIAESRALPEYTTAFKGTSAEFSGAVTAASATIGSVTAGVAKLTTGAAPNYTMGCLDSAGTMAWKSPGTVNLEADQVWSEHIADADGTSGQLTTTGKGVKTPHLQDSAVTLAKLGTDLKTTAGTAYCLFPRGGIIMWSGTLGGAGNKYPIIGGSSNTAWHICDGTDGTPDLRGYFIVGSTGAAGAYPVNAHPTPAASITLSHSHGVGTYASASHYHSADTHHHQGPSHTHPAGTLFTKLFIPFGYQSIWSLEAAYENWYGNRVTGTSSPTGSSGQNQSNGTAIGGATAGGGDGDTGGIQGQSNTGNGGNATLASGSSETKTLDVRPPYYALAYIIKL